MPKNIGKSIKIYLAKLKKLPLQRYSASLLSVCKYPKTPSFFLDHHVLPENHDAKAATLADVDAYLDKNFRSLYLDDSPIPSGRFLCSPLQTSSSLLPTSASSSDAKVGSVAVAMLSNDPYDDFRKSMKEVIEAKHFEEGGEELDWDFMEELLFCYLELNDKAAHKYILKAFTDMAASFQRRMKGELRRKKAYTD